MTNRICPYPGLRPFTEEESIFFKGRDQHIRQIVKLLEQNKMAFITGASGDGKSSMVYAGVLPYLRAGFFKADYNGWMIVDFKPQKNPLLSLSEALAGEVASDAIKIAEELRNGFSSLVDIYKASPAYAQGEGASNRGRNLLIIADQFEEVFTNFENFDQGRPSDESYTAVNLLLETIRISIVEKLPVYVIFTMRSDFISQCTVFKDLPEFIAYSQFFVPQLKRTEIRQVIEEPALMAGGSISPRLTEVIINNLNSGFDQLPVLQHALNLLWRMADNGAATMDLVHLAKIAGISSDVLSPEDRGEFERWYRNLPEYHHKYYEHPDLNNVLNAHAGILYESAYDYFMQNSDWAEKNITPQESKEIIETVFKSLTKIDNNRPVRNRCTLSEITGIINRDNITNATVCGVINIFRTPENSLIKPFSIPGRTDTQYISGDTVLDVTHEALIRNWRLLSEWDVQEASDMKDYHDFNSQMQLWISNNRQSAYLLNSGTYTYFNQWFNRSNPNPSLFLKYDNSKLPQRQKVRNAQYKYENYVDFLEASYQAILAKEQAVKRRVRYVIYGLIAFIVTMGGFVWWAMQEKANAEHQQRLAEDQKQYAEQQRAFAEKQEELANQANRIATEQRDTAQMMYERAVRAMTESERQRRIAILAHKEAKSAQERAEYNYLLAQQQRDSVEMQRNQLQVLMDEAEAEREKSRRLNDIAVSNLLAMKAKGQYENPMLNLRLLETAYLRTMGEGNTPDLYDAALYAMDVNKMMDPLKVTNQKMEAIAVNDDDQIVCFTQTAGVFTYAQDGGKPRETLRITKYETKLPVTAAIFADGDNVIYSTSDHNAYHINIKTQERFKLSSPGERVVSARMSADAKMILVGFQGGKLLVLRSTDTDGHQIAQVNLKSRVVDACFSPSNTDVFILTQKGELIKWSFNDQKQKTIFVQKDNPASALVPIPDKRQVAVCFRSGSIEFVDIRTDTQAENALGGHSGLDRAIYNTESGRLVVSGSDKSITVINVRRLKDRALSIQEHALGKSEVLGLGLSTDGERLYVLTSDNALRLFHLDLTWYMNHIGSTKSPIPINQEEQNLIIGDQLNFGE